MKIGVIGYGNMGSMIVNNILKLNLLLDDEELIVSNRHLNKFESLIEEYPEENLSITSDNKEVATQCQKILISVETPQFKEIIEEIKPFLNENTHIIYTCSGLNFNHIKQYFDGKLSLVIPTLASTVTSNNSISSLARRKGVTLVKHNSKVELQERLFVEDLFNEFSYVRRIDNPIYFNEEENNLDPSDNELEISIKYPSFKYRKLNKRIKYIINKYSREIKNTPFDDNYHIYTLYIDYKEYKYKDYISLVFYSELFLGGAHPNHYIDTVIYNTKNNSFININDLINIDKNILIKLSNISREELLKNKALSNSDVKEMLMDGTSPKTDNFKKIALTDEGIIIFFERYQIAPYYFGDYNILIPYSKLNLNI